MNLEAATTTVTQLPIFPQRYSSCDRHPDQQVTGFCASCLRERLAGLDPANNTSTTLRKSSTTTTTTITAATALKSIFKASLDRNKPSTSSSTSTSFFPELRRCKSFSGGRGERFSGVLEPQRKSCDVRGRSTLSSLFNLDDGRKVGGGGGGGGEVIEEVCADLEVEETRNNSVFSGVGGPVFESREEEEEEEEEVQREEEEIRVSDDVVVSFSGQSSLNLVVEDKSGEIQEEKEVEEEEEIEELKKMKDHIDLESQSKKPSGRDLKEIAGSFWLAASVFSKKLQIWRRKQKMKKRENERRSAAMPVQKRVGRRFRETQSEIADYGYGRRSCDTDPRISLDACRMSFDDPRYSWDEPRASWDGYLIGKMFPRVPPMVSVVESVVEDVPVPVRRSDNQIPVEEPLNSNNEDDSTPGGSAQTRDYYSDSSSSQRRRKSLDRSNSIRKTAAAVVAEVDEMKSISNAKVSPATIDYIHSTKVLVKDRDLRDLKDFKSNSLRDDRSESFDSTFRDSGSVIGGGDRKTSKKSRSRRWRNIWGLIHKRSGSKNDDDERYSRGSVVERSFSESWPELRRDVNGEAKGAFNRKNFRCNSSVSSRNFSSTGGLFGSARSSNAESNGNGKKRRDDFMLERNRSARYSPNNLENGLLRFYLTPLRGSRRNGSGKSKPNNSHSIAKSILRLN